MHCDLVLSFRCTSSRHNITSVRPTTEEHQYSLNSLFTCFDNSCIPYVFQSLEINCIYLSYHERIVNTNMPSFQQHVFYEICTCTCTLNLDLIKSLHFALSAWNLKRRWKQIKLYVCRRSNGVLMSFLAFYDRLSQRCRE